MWIFSFVIDYRQLRKYGNIIVDKLLSKDISLNFFLFSHYFFYLFIS